MEWKSLFRTMSRNHIMNRRLALVALLLCFVTALGAGAVASFVHPAHRAEATALAQVVPIAAQSGDEIWQALPHGAAGRSFRLRHDALRRVLDGAPREATAPLAHSQTVLALPLADGRLARFRVQESPVMEAALAARFPEIKSYHGQGVDDPAATTRFAWSPRGLHGVILGGDYSVYIYPPDANDTLTHVATQDVDRSWRCDVNDTHLVNPGRLASNGRNTAVGSTLRIYRIAIATTQEYTNDPQLGGGSIPNAVASLNAWLNGVNAIYERELAVRLTLVNNTGIIRTTEPDGFTNGDVGALLNEVRPVLATEVGIANYDVGHIFSTDGGGGVAAVGVVCNNNTASAPAKGSGSSSLGGPSGNAGGVGLLAHELGHQFGSLHTFNGTVGFCGPNRSPTAAYESGSGTTIMAYNGICVSGENTDNISGAEGTRFHNGSFTQIANFLASGGTACGTTPATGNGPPTVSGGPDRIIPRNTPFTLTATVSDPDAGDFANITYNWEQIDAAGANFFQNGTAASYSDAGDPPTTTRPIFRPFPSSANPARTFPSLTYILNNANVPPAMTNGFWTAENLPSVTRTVNFRVTARDNRAGGGGVGDDHVALSVVGNSGPFQVTAPNTAVNWTVGSTQTVTWDVNNTNNAPVNCVNVKISLSTDGGQSFPFVLAGSTPNDGSQSVTVPMGLNTLMARVKIEAIGNIFFDISNVNFSINAGAGCMIISGVSPPGGLVGATVTLTGAGFTGVTAVKFSANQTASFTIVSDTTITATIPAGATSGPITLSKASCPDVRTADFLVCANTAALSVDDGTPNFAAGGVGTQYEVNRLTPAAYPATLTAVQLRFDSFQGFPAGTSLTVLGGGNTDGDANISNTSFQMVAGAIVTLGQFVTYNLTTPITINSGDFVVGYSISAVTGQFAGLVDSTNPQGRSYFSFDGVNFGVFGNNNNLLIRAQYLTGCANSVSCPTASNINPASGAPGAGVTITGANFMGVNAVKFSNNVSAAFSVNSPTQITATIPPGAVTGPITISRPNCSDVQTASFTVSPIVCPTVTGLTPASAQTGSTVTITGTGFTGVTVVKFHNNVSAVFTVDSPTQITATVPVGASVGPIRLSKPGCADAQTPGFTPCNSPLMLQVDDDSPEFASGALGINYQVNRLTPIAYPATLTAVQIRLDSFQGFPAGASLTVLGGANTDGDANINNTSFQMVAGAIVALGQFVTYNLTTPITINSGDFLVGYSISAVTGQFSALVDNSIPQGRSYVSFNGVNFFVFSNNNNLLIRGQYTLGCSAVNCPTVNNLNPASAQVGANVTITGASFTGVNAVRFSNNVPATFSAVNDTTITTTVPAGAVTGPISLNKPGCPETQSGTFTVNPPPCMFTINPPSQNFGAGGGSGSFMLTASDDACAWMATSNAGWITLANSSGTGSGSVGFIVAANTGPARTGGITIPGQSFTVTQDSGCAFSLNPTSQNFPVAGGNGTVNVTASNAACAWTATSDSAWITITSGASGTGNGAVNYTVAANTVQPRSGTITAGGQAHSVTQSGIGLMYYPLPSPVRLLDTRPGESACFTPGTPLGNDAVRLQEAVGACSGIPASARVITGNATVVNFISTGFHWITLYPSDAAQPNASNLNFSDNQIVPNNFTVGLGPDGAFKIYSHASTHFIVDITGYYAPPGQGGLYYHPLPAPVRLLDTRPGETACDAPGVPLAGDGTRTVLAHRTCLGATIPSTAKAVVGNATVVNFISSGFHWITLYPFGTAQPNASNLNFTANQIVPNAFVSGLSTDGKFNIYSHASTHFIVDVTGYFSDQAVDVNGQGLLYNPLPAPVRLLDTRPGEPGCDAPGLPLGNDATRMQTAHRTCFGAAVPPAAKAVVGNATVVNFISSGFHWITLYPFGAPEPNASNLNFTANQIVPNAFVVGLSSDGRFNIYSHASTHFIVDLTGYFAP